MTPSPHRRFDPRSANVPPRATKLGRRGERLESLDRAAIDALPVAVVGSDRDGKIVQVNPSAETLLGYRAAELLGRPVEVLVPRKHREVHPRHRAEYLAHPVGRPMGAGRVLAVERKDGTALPVEILLGTGETAEGPSHYAVFIDVSMREARLAKQVATRSALADLGRLGLTAPARQLIDEAVAITARNLDADAVIISELARNGRSLKVRAATGPTPANSLAEQLEAADYVLARPTPVALEELLQRGLLDESRLRARKIHSGICLQIEEIGGRPYGVLEAHSASERAFDEDAIAFLRSVASIVSGAIDLAQRQPLFELATDMLAVADRDGYLVRFNPAWQRTLGWTEKELGARRFVELSHPEDREATLAALGELHPGDAEVFEFETRFLTKSGEYRTLLVSGRLGPDGQWIYYGAKDVTERRMSEAAARQAAAENELILHSAGEGIIRVASDGTITYANATGAELLGWSRDELIGRHAHTTIHHRRSDGAHYHAADCAAVHRTARGEIARVDDEVFWRADGTSFPVEYTSAPLQANGETSGAVIVFSDISPRRELETEAQLKRTAEEASLAKSEFLSRMSHELRTPLNAILGFGQLLERTGLAERERGFCEHITKGGRHLLSMIDEILEISRIESGNLGISVEPVRLAYALGDALELIGPIADQHGVTIETDLGDHAETYVLADLQRVKQVLLNLLSNAVKYNRADGHVRIAISSDHEALTVRVSDTGPGIASEDLERLFSPFDRLGAEGRGIEGTGLGLALSRRLTEAMGGTIEVTSELGVGSTFHVRLAKGTHQEPKERRRSHADPQRASLHPCKVLCIEDNVANLRLVEAVLGDHDTKVLAAGTGQLGIDIATSTRPDVVLLDLNLPDMHGDAVLNALRSRPQTATIPVIAVTADATAGQREHMLQLGANAYLTKPLDIDMLIGAITDACKPRP